MLSFVKVLLKLFINIVRAKGGITSSAIAPFLNVHADTELRSIFNF